MFSPKDLFDLSDIPQVEVNLVQGSYRWNVIDGLTGHENRGIELGVAAGSFSKRMVDSGRFMRFWGVDSYSDSHDTGQYKTALAHIGIESPYTLLRMTFAQALDVFPDGFFDFIYIDGYAHTGEEGGRTMIDWYAKLRVGGIMAGDDYHAEKWPLVVWGVNHFVRQVGAPLHVTQNVLADAYNQFPSWFFVKPAQPPASPLIADPELVAIGKMARLLRDEATKEKRREKYPRAPQGQQG